MLLFPLLLLLSGPPDHASILHNDVSQLYCSVPWAFTRPCLARFTGSSFCVDCGRSLQLAVFLGSMFVDFLLRGSYTVASTRCYIRYVLYLGFEYFVRLRYLHTGAFEHLHVVLSVEIIDLVWQP